MREFGFNVLAEDKKSRARAGVICVNARELETPAFVTVATGARVRGLSSGDLKLLDMKSAIVNTYHLHFMPLDKLHIGKKLSKNVSHHLSQILSKNDGADSYDGSDVVKNINNGKVKGCKLAKNRINDNHVNNNLTFDSYVDSKPYFDELIKKKGGVHKVMGYDGVLFSDSGGFQVFSLSHNMKGINKLGKREGKVMRDDRLVKIKSDGVEFVSVYESDKEKKEFMGPKESMNIQSNIGADIIMAFDECPSPLDDYEYNVDSLERTNRWAIESLKYRDKKQALYGIVQGGPYRDLREKSAEFISSLGFDGVAIGGIFGDKASDMHEVLDWIAPLLDERPRHLLGIGEVEDIFECVSRGIDTFDCVMPTRNARHGNLLVTPKGGGKKENKFRLNIENAKYKIDRKVIEKGCGCEACGEGISRKKLRELYKSKDEEYLRLSTMHNLYFMFSLMEEIREAIKDGKFGKLKKMWVG